MAQLFASAIDTDACSVECLHPDQIRPLLGKTLSREGASAIVSMFEALTDPSRARIVHLLALAQAELCVCDIAVVLGMSVSALSHQLRWLRERGAVTRRKAGRIVYYRLADERIRNLVVDAAARMHEVA